MSSASGRSELKAASALFRCEFSDLHPRPRDECDKTRASRSMLAWRNLSAPKNGADAPATPPGVTLKLLAHARLPRAKRKASKYGQVSQALYDKVTSEGGFHLVHGMGSRTALTRYSYGRRKRMKRGGQLRLGQRESD